MIRSGSARIGVTPPWEKSIARQTRLMPFPGTQVSIVLPEL
jgi:hypothetical protein